MYEGEKVIFRRNFGQVMSRISTALSSPIVEGLASACAPARWARPAFLYAQPDEWSKLCEFVGHFDVFGLNQRFQKEAGIAITP